ncbi:hypothetical protein [Trinickia sp.]|uniref:hypothetical protein n=1 Tax=Trinickia sp. TaxID=2571163 RepID=UPI003F7E45C9
MINHLEGDRMGAFLKSPQTFPEGFCIGDWEFGAGRAIQSSRDFATVEVDIVDGAAKRSSRGARVAFNLRPQCEAARDMAAFPVTEYSAGRYTTISRRSGFDKIAATIYFPDGSELDLTGGAVVSRDLREANHQFVVLFSDVH